MAISKNLPARPHFRRFRCYLIGLLCITLAACSKPITDLNAAEQFIDAFYSFDANQLKSTLSSAPESAPYILYYQGWAEGGNYNILQRSPCQREANNEITCSITVADDLIKALGLTFDATDTFHLTIADGVIVKAITSSDDPPEVRAAQAWVQKERAAHVEEPCRGLFAGGPTPQQCAQAVVAGFREFAAQPK